MYINGQRVVIKIVPVIGAPKCCRRSREIMVDEDTVNNELFLSRRILSAKLLMQILNQITRVGN